MSTILIADDLAANRELLVALLRYKGHHVLEAADGRDALAVVNATHPDLVITDVLMPVMDGYELVKQMRLDPSTSGIPVVFYTAHYGEREARALAQASGVADVLTKPAEPEEVLLIVDRVLSREAQSGTRPEVLPLTPAFDREHLRLLTDKLSEKTDDVRAANARLRALINIGLELASERDTDRLLQSVCDAARDLFGATFVTLGIVSRDALRLERLITAGAGAGGWIESGDAVPGILTTVAGDRRTVRGDNPDGDPAGLLLPTRHPPVQAFLAAPIASPAHVYGWIFLAGNEGRSFHEDDEQLLTALAGQAGRIYENGHVYALAQAERDRAQRYLDTADTILLALDLHGRITMVNRFACSILGWTAEELVGRVFVDTCVPPAKRDAARQKLSEGHADDSSVESAVITRSGDERLIEWRTSVLRDEAGRILSTLSSGTDVTDRRRAEEDFRQRTRLSALTATVGLSLADTDTLAEALQRCAEALVTHLEAALVRIWTLNTRDDMLELQASAGLYTHVTGLHAKVPLGQSDIGRIARDRKPYLTNAVIGDAEVSDQDWVRRERLQAFAGYPLVVDGRVVGVLVLFARQVLTNPVASALVSVADHIALGIERHRSAEALEATEERMRYAMQSAGVGVWDMDYVTGVLQWSETLEAHYGLAPGTFGGTFEAFIARVHPDDRESLLETVGKAVKSGGDFTVQNRSISPDGSVRWLSGAGRVLLGKRGEPVRAVGVSIDVTERHRLQEQFQHAQKMEAVGRLAGGVAHDFNNLLTSILGYCELLLDDVGDDHPCRPDITEIQKAGTRAAGLTRQLLAFSRKQIIEPTLLDLSAVVADMQGMLRRLIGEDIKVAVSLGPDLSLVKADRGQIEQVVMNLAVNARDAMSEGGTLTIETAAIELDEHYASTHLAATPGHHVGLTVTDTGGGMTAEVQARLFEPFFTTKEPGKGTGLGLATVYGIVTRAGGSIGVYSELGRGTSFKVYFPCADASEVVAPVPPPVARPRGGTQTVLVVEDEHELRELTKRLLERQGYTVLMAADADDALRLCDEHQFIDVLLTDVVMPGASGPELTRQILEQRPELKVIYMSGYTEDTIVRHGVLNPGIAFLHKPFTSDGLGRKIRDALDQ